MVAGNRGVGRGKKGRQSFAAKGRVAIPPHTSRESLILRPAYDCFSANTISGGRTICEQFEQDADFPPHQDFAGRQVLEGAATSSLRGVAS